MKSKICVVLMATTLAFAGCSQKKNEGGAGEPGAGEAPKAERAQAGKIAAHRFLVR